tara:strand:+ start:3363 stop:3773 length:411 start_codon:yes stop_codon:yes gene_type:complete
MINTNQIINSTEKNTKRFDILGLYRYSLIGSIRRIQTGIKNKKRARENYVSSPVPSGSEEPLSLYETQIWMGVIFLLLNIALTTWAVVIISIYYKSLPIWAKTTGLIFLLLGGLGFLPIIGLIISIGCIYAGKYSK